MLEYWSWDNLNATWNIQMGFFLWWSSSLKFRSTTLENKHCHGYNYLTIYQPGTIRPCQFSSPEQIALKSGWNSVLRLRMGILIQLQLVLIQLQHYKTEGEKKYTHTQSRFLQRDVFKKSVEYFRKALIQRWKQRFFGLEPQLYNKVLINRLLQTVYSGNLGKPC